MSRSSLGEFFIYREDIWLKANVLVETTIGTRCFHAFSLPQKHTESVYTTSGSYVLNSLSRKLSIRRVMRISWIVISVVDTVLSATSSCAVSFGRNSSQETKAAPVALIFSLNSLKE